MWLGTCTPLPGVGEQVPRRDQHHGEEEEREEDAGAPVDQLLGHAHASTARPRCGNSPRGRFWMKRMMKTRIRILPSTAPATGLEELVRDAEREGRRERPPEVPRAAEHHHEERVDDVALPEVRRDVVDLAERHAREPGDPRARARRSARRPAPVRMPISAAIARFCVTARICSPSGVRLSSVSRPAKTTSAKMMM